jgi:hypothetical protein
MGTTRPPIKKKALHAHYGFAAAFENNDRKILHRDKVIRKYQIAEVASSYDKMNARNRLLAIELCKMLGFPDTDDNEGVGFVGVSDISAEENRALLNEEMMLNRAGAWIASRANASDVVKSILDFLRISGRYETTKENIL